MRKDVSEVENIEKAADLLDASKNEEALALLKKAEKTASEQELFSIMELYYDWGFLEEGITIAQQFIAKYPGEGEFLVLLSDMYIESGKDEEALQLLNKVNKSDPFYMEALLISADLYQSQGLFEVSEQKLLEGKEIAPEEIVIDFALAELLFSIGEANRAIPFYEKVWKETQEMNGIEIADRLAESHASLGHFDEALNYFEQLDTNHPDTLFKYGLTAVQQERYDIAIPMWEKVIELDPYYHTVYSELAQALVKEGRIQEAYETIQQGLQQDEYNKEIYITAAEIALQLGKESEAFTYLKDAISLDFEYQEAILMLVGLYKEREQFEDIVELLEDVIDLGASSPLYQWELAQAYEENEQFSNALKAYEKAYDGLAHDSEFLKAYGYFLTEEGRFEKAVTIFESYLKLEPMDEDILMFMERLKSGNE